MSNSRHALELRADERWYLVQTLHNRERKARFHLAAQGFSTFLPQYVKTVTHARQLKTVNAPLFPGYLFVRLDLDRDRWLCVHSTVGVMQLLTYHDGYPIPLPPGIVEDLIERSEGEVTRLDVGLIPGQTVRILSGPFADMMGRLGRLDAAGRVQVLLNMMGAKIALSLNRSALSPAA